MTVKAQSKIGFTGTRRGMTIEQRKRFIETITKLAVVEFHHGDCTGADAQAHAIVKQYAPSSKIVVHPPIEENRRAFCKGDMEFPCRAYLRRNRDIVNTIDLLIGTPCNDTPVRRGSGTWYTLGYAQKLGVARMIILPSGKVEKA